MENKSFESLYRSWFDLSKIVLSFLSPPKVFPPESQSQDWQSELLMQTSVGPFIEAYKDYLDLMSSQFELYRHSADLWMKFSGVWVEGNQAAMSRIASETAKSDVDPVKRAYHVWVEELEKRFDILLRDEEFTTKLGSFVSSYLAVKRRSDGILERHYSRMNIPTKSEVNGIYKKLHDLEKKVDKLSREREELGVQSP